MGIERNKYSDRALISVDLTVLSVVVLAVVLLALTMFRTDATRDTLADGGLIALQDRDTLVAFQDFSFNVSDWVTSPVEDRMIGLGPVLGGLTTVPARRTFQLPDGTTQAVLQFDIFLNGTWTPEDGVTVVVNDNELVWLPWADADPAALTIDQAGLSVQARPTVFTPQSDTNDGRQVLHYAVRVTLAADAGDLTLRLLPQMDAADRNATWAIDNVSVIAREGSAPGA